MSTVALVPLRGGSKGIPKKNIKLLLGKPLCYWVLKAAVDSKVFDKVVVSTDNREIKKVVKKLKLPVSVISRPSRLAKDTSTTESVMMHTMDVLKDVETMVTIQATSPLLTSTDLKEATLFYRLGGFDSMLSCVEFNRFLWTRDGAPLNYNFMNRERRQDYAGNLLENGAFYITSSEILHRYKCRLGEKIGMYIMPSDAAIELDEPGDWPIVEQLLRRRQLEQR